MQTSSSVRPECLLYRGNIYVAWNPLLAILGVSHSIVEIVFVHKKQTRSGLS